MKKLTLTVLSIGGLAWTAHAEPKHLLVVSLTQGFRHSSIETGENVVRQLAERSGKFTLDFASVNPRDPKFAVPTENAGEEQGRRRRRGRRDNPAVNTAVRDVLAAKMNPEALEKYDGVIFLNTTGTLPIPDMEAFHEWMKAGHAFIGMHSAADTFRGKDFPTEYTKMINCEFRTHGRQETVELSNVDPTHAATKDREETWTVHDEMYLFKNYERSRAHSLLNMTEHPNERTPGHYPVAWCRDYGKGRVFYTSLGHREDVWDPEWKDRKGNRLNSPEVAHAYQKHILGGILWALGLAEGDSQPQVAKP